MPRFLAALLALLSAGSLAHAQRIVATMRTHPSCPVTIASVASSRDYGFQQAALRNESDKTTDSLSLTVVLTVGGQEEVVDGGRVFARLEPGSRKTVDVFLGQMQALRQRAQELKLPVARAIVFVDSVDFSDGTRWEGQQTVLGPGDQPLRK